MANDDDSLKGDEELHWDVTCLHWLVAGSQIMSWFTALKQKAADIAAVVSSEVQKASEELLAESPRPETEVGENTAALPWENHTGVLGEHEHQLRNVILNLSRDIETFTVGRVHDESGQPAQDGADSSAKFRLSPAQVQIAKALLKLDPLLKQRRYAIVRPRSTETHRTEQEFWANYFFHVDGVLHEIEVGLREAGDDTERQSRVFRRILQRLESCSAAPPTEQLRSEAALPRSENDTSAEVSAQKDDSSESGSVLSDTGAAPSQQIQGHHKDGDSTKGDAGSRGPLSGGNTPDSGGEAGGSQDDDDDYIDGDDAFISMELAAAAAMGSPNLLLQDDVDSDDFDIDGGDLNDDNDFG